MTTARHDELLAAVVAAGLPGSLLQLPREQLSEEDADALVATARRHRIAGMVLKSVETGNLLLPAAARTTIVDLHGREVAGSRRLESELVWVAGVLDRAGIESRVVGDVALVRLDYRDPALRAVSTIGLLVHPDVINRVIQLLRASGWQARPDRHGGAALSGPSGLQLELHTTVHPTPPGVSIDVPTLWADRRELPMGRWVLSALGDEQRLLQTCCHALVDDQELACLVRQRDIAEAVLFGGWDCARLMGLAAAWNAEEVLGRAVRTVWQRLAIADVTRLSVWAGADRSSSDSDQGPSADTAAVPPRPPAQRTWGQRLLPKAFANRTGRGTALQHGP